MARAAGRGGRGRAALHRRRLRRPGGEAGGGPDGGGGDAAREPQARRLPPRPPPRPRHRVRGRFAISHLISSPLLVGSWSSSSSASGSLRSTIFSGEKKNRTVSFLSNVIRVRVLATCKNETG